MFSLSFRPDVEELRSTHPELLQGVPQLAQGCWKGTDGDPTEHL